MISLWLALTMPGCARPSEFRKPVGPSPGQNGRQIPSSSGQGFSVEDERTLRNAVYLKDIWTTIPREGEWEFTQILVVPKEVTAIYKKDRLAALKVLQKIVEGGNPKDAMLAAGYAISLVRSPAVGVVCVEGRDEAGFDRFDEAWQKTPRQHWAGRVAMYIENVSMDFATTSPSDGASRPATGPRPTGDTVSAPDPKQFSGKWDELQSGRK